MTCFVSAVRASGVASVLDFDPKVLDPERNADHGRFARDAWTGCPSPIATRRRSWPRTVGTSGSPAGVASSNLPGPPGLVAHRGQEMGSGHHGQDN